MKLLIKNKDMSHLLECLSEEHGIGKEPDISHQDFEALFPLNDEKVC